MNLYFPTISKQLIPLHKAFAKNGIVFGMATSIWEMQTPAGALFQYHAKQIIPADSMKMAVVQETQGVFKHEQNDALLQYGSGHGHCLYWGQRYADWLPTALENSNLEQRYALLESHITECMKHYAEWDSMDVINEGLTQESPWSQHIPDSIEFTLDVAKQANSKLKRYYNGVFLGWPKEQSAVLNLIDKGLIDGIGVQWHRKAGMNDGFWIPELLEFCAAVRSKGLPIRFSEVSIRSNGNETDFNYKWAEAVRVALEIGVTHFVQWGIYDTSDSWQKDSLLFDKQGLPKSAYYTVIDSLI